MKGNNDDYISFTDVTKSFDGVTALIEQWLRNKDTMLFLGIRFAHIGIAIEFGSWMSQNSNCI